MPYKSFMVHLDPTVGAFKRLSLAVALAKEFDAQLIGFTAAETGEPLTLSAGTLLPLLKERRREFEIGFESLQKSFTALTAHMRTQWRAGLAQPVDFAANNARAADLIILGRSADPEADPRFLMKPASLLMTAGRPLLLVPPDIESLSGDKIVVAWKSGRHARLALQQALPLLARASQATVLGVGEETTQDELDDVCAYLHLHGVPATSQRRGLGHRTVAKVLIDVAASIGADLIVSGGYGRGQLREWVLGGVTKDLLAASPFCCLMSH